MLRVLLYIVAGIVLLGAVVVMVGYALPQDHVASGSAHLTAPPDAVFATISDVRRYPEWRSDVSSVEVIASSPLRWHETSGGDTITFEVVESRPPEHFRVRIADANLPFGGTWTYELTPDTSGTHLVITEHGHVYNPVFRFVSRLVFGHTATIDRYLAALARRVTRS